MPELVFDAMALAGRKQEARAMPPRRDPQPALGAAIRELRQRAELSQETVAGHAGVHPTWLSRIEGGGANPAWGTVVRLAQAMSVPVSELAATEEQLRNADSKP